MASALRTYSLQGCQITFGPQIVSGFSPDDAITIEPSGPAFISVVGADGDLSMAQVPVTYKVKISLSQTSKCNEAFSAIHRADVITGGGVLPFGFKDSRGTSLCVLTASRIMGEPSAASGTTIKNREWNIEGVGTNFVGGN